MDTRAATAKAEDNLTTEFNSNVVNINYKGGIA